MIEERPSQAVCIDHLAHTDTLIERFEQWARAPGQKFLADKSSARRRRSERTLARLSHQVLGKASVDATASEVGYGVTLRTLLTSRRCGELRSRG